MYSFLTDPIENRLIDELRQLAQAHPVFRRMVPYIKDTFPYNEQGQEGIYIEDTSGSHFALTSSNFLGNHFSHVFAAQVADQPQGGASSSSERPLATGSFVEWVIEDPAYYLQQVIEDVSDQVADGNDLFTGTHGRWIRSLASRDPASIFDVRVWVNGIPDVVREVDPTVGSLRTRWVEPNSTVKIQYIYHRNPEAPGLYYIQITGENMLSMRRMGVAKSEVLTEAYDLEVEFQLANTKLIPRSLRIYTATRFLLQENVHYTVDYDAGKVIITNPSQVPKNRRLVANYQFDGGQQDDLAFAPNEANNQLIPGVIVAFGERAERGAIAVVGALPERVGIADIYGGRWDISVSMMVYARDPDTRQKLVDWLSTSAIALIKERFDADGITFKDLTIGGKTRIPYQEGVEDYFGQSISITLQSDWEVYRSYPLRIEGFWIGQEYMTSVVAPTPALGPLLVSPREMNTIFNTRERYV